MKYEYGVLATTIYICHLRTKIAELVHLLISFIF